MFCCRSPTLSCHSSSCEGCAGLTLVLFVPLLLLLVGGLSSLQQLPFGSTLPKAYFYYCVMELCSSSSRGPGRGFYLHVAGKLLVFGSFSLPPSPLQPWRKGSFLPGSFLMDAAPLCCSRCPHKQGMGNADPTLTLYPPALKGRNSFPRGRTSLESFQA